MDRFGNGHFYYNQGSIFKTTILDMKNILVAGFALLLMNSCTKTETNSASTENEKSTEIGLVQKPLTLKSPTGEEISVTYFSEGDVVAVKIQKAGEEEQKLSAKTVNPSGNPIFTNEEFMWELTQEGQAGKLSDKDGNVTEYN